MLQHNVHAHDNAPHDHGAHKAHWAHAIVVSLHALCCGLPAMAMLIAAVSGAASASVLLPEFFVEFHAFMHAYELWILVGSALLVIIGGILELAHRRLHPHLGFPWLYAMSISCFVANAAIILTHQVLT